MGQKGGNNIRPIEVTLSDLADKGVIYKHTKNLKGVKNTKRFTYQIRNQLPERLQEEDNRRRQMVSKNKYKAKNNTAHNISMRVKKNKLFVNNTLYKKKIVPANEQDLLNMTEEERENVQEARLASTTMYTERDNKFIGYVLESAEVKEICSVYQHLQLKHPQATHISIAYNIAGENPELSDYADNGEIGAGSRMLKILENRKATNVAVYIVLYHSGQNLCECKDLRLLKR